MTARNPVSRIVKSFKVWSRSDATFVVKPAFQKGYLKPGVMTRLALAEAIERRLNGKRKLA